MVPTELNYIDILKHQDSFAYASSLTTWLIVSQGKLGLFLETALAGSHKQKCPVIIC